MAQTRFRHSLAARKTTTRKIWMKMKIHGVFSPHSAAATMRMECGASPMEIPQSKQQRTNERDS